MSLLKMVKQVNELGAEWDKPIDDAEALHGYAEAAYACYVKWFGAPADPKRPYKIMQESYGSGFGTCCFYCLGKYNIVITDNYITPAQRCEAIAHEMYHRMTMRRDGLGREVWVSEMMAFLASYWFLPTQGFQDYRASLRDEYLKQPGKVDMAVLRAAQRPRRARLLASGEHAYSPELGFGTARLGIALSSLVEWQPLCRIISAKSLDEWIATLPAELHYPVCRILDVPCPSTDLPDATSYNSFGFALYAIGDHAAAIDAFRQAIEFEPENADSYFRMALSLGRLGQKDAALQAWQEAARLDPAHVWAAFNVADTFHAWRDYASAIEWYEETLRRKPDWAKAYYWLGDAYARKGDVPAARASWKKVIALNDAEYAESARQSIENWPLPTLEKG